MIESTKIFKKASDTIIVVILYIMLFALIIGTINIVLNLSYFFSGTIEEGFQRIIIGVLTLFIVLELFKNMVEYARHERIKLTYVTDATILILMREISVGLYSQGIDYKSIFALSTLLFVMGIIRVLAIVYSPREREEQKSSA